MKAVWTVAEGGCGGAQFSPDCPAARRLRAAAGRLVLLYLPTYSPGLNPIEMLWRQFRREVTHCELFGSVKALLVAAQAFFDRYNQQLDEVLSIIGSNAA